MRILILFLLIFFSHEQDVCSWVLRMQYQCVYQNGTLICVQINRSPVKLKKYGTLVYVQIVGPSIKLKNKKVAMCNGSFLNKWYRVSQLFACLKVTLCAYVSARDSLGGSKGGYTAQKKISFVYIMWA